MPRTRNSEKQCPPHLAVGSSIEEGITKKTNQQVQEQPTSVKASKHSRLGCDAFGDGEATPGHGSYGDVHAFMAIRVEGRSNSTTHRRGDVLMSSRVKGVH
ncbi:hypothetical protein HAX54_039949 [Datura stramonium]|uniref:Uncharacterized protein n=1 Tax=Datura stramonium TaxID=4076 RepID=A0ABS8SJN5_DATST|nr:hypothetical protein [Datura stramonium]